MDLTRFTSCSVFFVTAAILIIRANAIFGRMLDEVNSNRAANEQIYFLFVRLRFGQVMDEHARPFPTDKKRRQMKISCGIGFALLFLVLLFLAVG